MFSYKVLAYIQLALVRSVCRFTFSVRTAIFLHAVCIPPNSVRAAELAYFATVVNYGRKCANDISTVVVATDNHLILFLIF